MKILIPSNPETAGGGHSRKATTPLSARPARSRERGVAVIVVLALLSILLVYIGGNIRSLSHLKRELKLVEQKQIHRLEAAARGTNAVPAQLTATSTNAAPAVGEPPPQPAAQ